ncbi:unnamed protein product [Cylindrotheca closterium]|uniref:RWD domain-containing protein n=1 Tax=Cylindrotheca closterium TaxID=2856 RepID=A0AAD2CGZ7_9STRA|nr:unnamed protein product [Cylindrotheca closterium]
MEDYDECKERRDAELEFVESAYAPEEAYCERADDSKKPPIIVRKLKLLDEESSDQQGSVIMLSMMLTLPLDYPIHSPLEVDVSLDQDGSSAGGKNATLMKAALNAIPRLNESCRSIAMEHQEEESVFIVFSQADEWIQDEWPNLCREYQQGGGSNKSSQRNPHTTTKDKQQSKQLVLGRRLIYSHHIISKIKRGDMKSLASHYKLTGYMKIGWPGLLIIEGLEEDCIAFYDEIRPWNWQYLVLRGEQQEVVSKVKKNNCEGDEDDVLQSHRKFERFLEVEDMSLVAQHCREVGLENLFRTSMKVYENEADDATTSEGEWGEQSMSYGALVHVDHMNNQKGYRKWLRKTSQETNCKVLIKQSYPNHDYNGRPKIVVGIIGDSRDQVGGFLKRWRTSKVDYDSRKIACYERQMTIVVEGDLPHYYYQIEDNGIDWNQSMSEESVNLPEENLAEYLQSIGGDEWEEAWWKILRGGLSKPANS